MTTTFTTPSGRHFNVYEMPSREEIAKHIARLSDANFKPEYGDRRGPNSYTNVVYPSRACGCITSARYTTTGRFHITCDPRDGEYSYKTRDEAAKAEGQIVLEMWRTLQSIANAPSQIASQYPSYA
jgi:hypothetical protein